METKKLLNSTPRITGTTNLMKEAWVLVVNNDNKYEPLKVTITKIIPSKWNNERVDYGVEYERLGRIVRVRIPDSHVYFTEWKAKQMVQHLNEEYD